MDKKTSLLVTVFSTIIVPIILIIKELWAIVSSFCVGWCAGAVIQLLFGGFIVQEINALLGTNHLTADMIPTIIGVLLAVGLIFNPYTTIPSEKSERS